jgi:hypothetical protein
MLYMMYVCCNSYGLILASKLVHAFNPVWSVDSALEICTVFPNSFGFVIVIIIVIIVVVITYYIFIFVSLVSSRM